MNATELTFTIKDVIAIVVAAIGILSFILALKASNKSNHEKLEAVVQELEKHKEETTEKITNLKNELKDKEHQLNARISEIRDEHRRAHTELSLKMDFMSKELSSIDKKLSELTGFLKGKGNLDE